MAKFCSEECKKEGSICDFCKHFKDNSLNTADPKDDKGLCLITNKEVSSKGGANCDNFECFNIIYNPDKYIV